jgi:hypothetical protein
MSGCPLAINSRPPQPLVGWLLRENLTLVIWEQPILWRLWENPSEEKPNQSLSDWASLKRLICVIRRLLPLRTVIPPDG